MEKVVWGAPSFWIERFPLYWGIDQGLFAKQGIDFEIWYAYGGPELARAISKGRIHIGEMGLPSFVTAYRQGLQAKIVGSSVIQQLDHYLAARPHIAATSDLGGCRIGILSIRERPGQTADLGCQVFGVTPEVFECALLRDLSRWEPDARLDMDGLQSALKVQETMGMRTADLSLDEMVSQL